MSSPNPYRVLPPAAMPAHQAALKLIKDRGATSIVVPLPRVDNRHPYLAAETVKPPTRKSLTAASQKIDLSKNAYSYRRFQTANWQQEGWSLMDQVGELHYAANLYANGLSRMRLELTRTLPDGDTIRLKDLRPEDLTETDKLARQIMKDFTTDQSIMEMQRIWGLNKFIAGEVLFVGVPRKGKARSRKLLDFSWKVYSREEVREENGLVTICGETYREDEVLIFRAWQPHPRFSHQPDSPVRSCLPILRELVGLTMYVSALIDSRLAGAGVLILPTSATVLGATAPEDDQEEDPTVAALIEAMVTPLKDRDSAASIVPLVLTVPDESSDLIRHLSFATVLEGAAKELRDEAVRRLALGLDMPPEQLLGLEGASHWTAWLLSEDTVRFQFVPGMQPFADAVVKEFLHPILEEFDVSAEDAELYGFQIEGDDLISRPNKFDEALELYRLDAITLSAVLKAGGFALTDAPVPKEDTDRAVDLAIKAVSINPSLFADPGLPNLVSQLRAVLDGKDASDAPPEALPPALQDTDGPGVGDAPTGQPATAKDKKPNAPGPAVNRPRDSNA